jgi:hypothetical protein
MSVPKREGTDMKFKNRELYITDSRKNTVKQNRAYKINMMIPDELNTVYVFKMNGVLDDWEKSVIARIKKPKKIYEEYGVNVEPTIDTVAQMQMIRTNSDCRFRKPAKYVYTILDYKLIVWRCGEVTFNYNLDLMSALYYLIDVYELNEEVENLYHFVYHNIGEIELSDEEFKQWKKESKKVKSYFKAINTIMKCAKPINS